MSIKPWIFWLIISAVLVIGWGIYEREKVEPENITENLSEQYNQSAAVLTNNPTPQPADKTIYTSITKATPQGSSRLVANTNRFDLQESNKRIIASIRPTVVNIKATRVLSNDNLSSNSANTKIRFVDPFSVDVPANTESIYESVGSGIFVSPQGHILTNYHVIANSKKIIVTVSGTGKQNYVAKIIDYHVDTDLTLLKIDAVDDFTVAQLGNSDLVEVGDWVLAFGSPFGMDQTVTDGIVSGKRKTLVIEGIRYENMIQTDAPINRGSSGGPLVNLYGDVIGINTAIYAPTGVFSGTGFAIPINQVKRFLSAHNIIPAGDLIQANNPSIQYGQGWLGLEIQPVDGIIAHQFGLPYIGGVLVNRVIYNSPAWNEGFERGDVILEFDGRKISSIKKLENLITDLSPTEKVKLLVFRDKKLKEFYVTLSEMPSDFEFVR
ncbi:S1C family serine protease [candidate division KSB1 bacterium]